MEIKVFEKDLYDEVTEGTAYLLGVAAGVVVRCLTAAPSTYSIGKLVLRESASVALFTTTMLGIQKCAMKGFSSLKPYIVKN